MSEEAQNSIGVGRVVQVQPVLDHRQLDSLQAKATPNDGPLFIVDRGDVRVRKSHLDGRRKLSVRCRPRGMLWANAHMRERQEKGQASTYTEAPLVPLNSKSKAKHLDSSQPWTWWMLSCLGSGEKWP